MLQNTTAAQDGKAFRLLARALRDNVRQQVRNQTAGRIGLRLGLMILSAFVSSVPAAAANQILLYGSSADFQFKGTGGNTIDVVLPSAGCSGGTFCLTGAAQGTGSVSSSVGTWLISSTGATPFTLAAAGGSTFAVSQSLPIAFSFTAPEGNLMGSVQFTSMSAGTLVGGSFMANLVGTLTVTGGTFAGVFASPASINLNVALHFPLTGLIGNTDSDTAEIDNGSTVTAAPPCATESSITSNFNGTPIPGGRFIWFNSNFSAHGFQNGTTITFQNSTIQFTANGVHYNLAVPNAMITFSASASCASTFFDTTTQTWHTAMPLSGSDEIFLSGLSFMVPGGGLPGGINPVVWQGSFSSNTPGVSLQWKWGAAVYTSFSTDYNVLGVKAAHTNTCSFNNSDHAGTPENFKSSVVGGARGGGGSNFTGSWSGTVSVAICP